MAITSEIIGKLGGGAGVEARLVSAPSALGSHVLDHVPVPAGKQYLVAVTGAGTTSTSSLSSYPKLEIGDTSVKMPDKNAAWACVAVITQDTDVIFNNAYNVRSQFSGTLYIAEM